jgi:acyl-CoA thioesterase
MDHEKQSDIMKMIREKDTFAVKLGIEILEAAEGRSKVTMPLGMGTANALGNVHGGAIFSIADMAFACAANSEGIVSVAIQANIHYMSPCVSEGTLFATAERVGETRRLGFYHIRVYTPEERDIALMQAIVYRKT